MLRLFHEGRACLAREAACRRADGAADIRRRGKTVVRPKAGAASPLAGPGSFPFETRCVSNHTACRFAEKARFFRDTTGGAALCRFKGNAF